MALEEVVGLEEKVVVHCFYNSPFGKEIPLSNECRACTPDWLNKFCPRINDDQLNSLYPTITYFDVKPK